ncbi:farnesyl cysteine-carboxyl methyltransferase [Rhizina undulata]
MSDTDTSGTPEWPTHVSTRTHHFPPEVPAHFYPAGTFALDGIALRAFALGGAFVFCVNIAGYLWLSGGFWQLPVFVGLLAGFHFLEFWITARFNTKRAKIDAFLLTTNGAAYQIAHTAAFCEAAIEYYFFPGIKSHAALTYLGLTLIVIGQFARSYAMAHCGSNFSHTVAVRHERDHVLVQTGIYRYMRHPSYFGFFWWGLGTQILLGNPICLVGYAAVLWKFFNDRIRQEEIFLVRFFEDEYVAYKNRTGTCIPFIK